MGGMLDALPQPPRGTIHLATRGINLSQPINELYMDRIVSDSLRIQLEVRISYPIALLGFR